MLRKVTHYAGCVSANIRPPKGDREMGTAISCTKWLMRPGIDQNVSFAVGDFGHHLDLF